MERDASHWITTAITGSDFRETRDFLTVAVAVKEYLGRDGQCTHNTLKRTQRPSILERAMAS